MSDYPMLISNKLHSFRNFLMQKSEYSTRLSTMLKTLVYSSNCRVVLSLVTESVTLAPSTIGKLLKV